MPALGGAGVQEPTGVVVRADDVVVLGLADGAPTSWRWPLRVTRTRRRPGDPTGWPGRRPSSGRGRGRYRGSTSISDVVTVVPGTSADVICDVATPVPAPVPLTHTVYSAVPPGTGAELVTTRSAVGRVASDLALAVGVLGADQELLARRVGLRRAVGERHVLRSPPVPIHTWKRR